jgi:hypothetical protein
VQQEWMALALKLVVLLLEQEELVEFQLLARLLLALLFLRLGYRF